MQGMRKRDMRAICDKVLEALPILDVEMSGIMKRRGTTWAIIGGAGKRDGPALAGLGPPSVGEVQCLG